MPNLLDGYEGLASVPGEAGDVARDRMDNPAGPLETPSDTAGRLFQDGQKKARIQRYRAADLAARDIPTYQADDGTVQPVVDSTGAALTQYDRKNKTGYDSAGNPQKLVYGETGPPTLHDPFEGMGPTVDQKTGDKYLIAPGQPWKYVGQDEATVAKNQAVEREKSLGELAKSLGGSVSLDQKDLHDANFNFRHGLKELGFDANTPPEKDAALEQASKQFESAIEENKARKSTFQGFGLGPKPEEIAADDAKIIQKRDATLKKIEETYGHRDSATAIQQQIEAKRAVQKEIADTRLEAVISKLAAQAPKLYQKTDAGITYASANAYDALQQAAQDGALGRQPSELELKQAQAQQVAGQKQLAAQQAFESAKKGEKLYSPDAEGHLDLSAKERPFDALQQAKADGVLTKEPSAEDEHHAWTAQAIVEARVGKKPYSFDDKGVIQFNEEKPFDSLNGAVADGVIPVPPPEVYKATEEKQKLIEEAGSNPQLKAILYGAGRGAAFLAAAPLGQGIGAALGGLAGSPAGPGDVVTVPIGATIGGFLGAPIAGMLGSLTYDKLLQKLGQYSDTINSFVASQKIHPYYATGGEIGMFGAGLPKIGMKAIGGLFEGGADALAEGSSVAGKTAADVRATIANAARTKTPQTQDFNAMASNFLDAIGKSYSGSGGGVTATINNLSEQAAILKKSGATGADVALKTAGDVFKSAAAMLAVDTIFKEGAKALGLSEEGQTWGGAGLAGLIGAFNSGHGINFEGYDHARAADLILRGAAHEKTGTPPGAAIPIDLLDKLGVKDAAQAQRYSQPLTPEEHEIYVAFGEKIAEMKGKGIDFDPAKVIISAKQALRSGRAQGVRAVSIEEGQPTPAGAAPTAGGLPSGGNPTPADGESAPSPAEATQPTGKAAKGGRKAATESAPSGSQEVAPASGETIPPNPAEATPLASTFPAGSVVQHGDGEVHVGKEGKSLTWQAVRGGQILAAGQETNSRKAIEAGKAALDQLQNAGPPSETPEGGSTAVPATISPTGPEQGVTPKNEAKTTHEQPGSAPNSQAVVREPSAPHGQAAGGEVSGGEVAKAEPSKKSSTQVTLPPKEAKAFQAFAKSIPDKALYHGEKGSDSYGPEYGRELEPHITALYGLTTDDAAAAREAVGKGGHGPVKVKLGKLSLFTTNPDYDVLKVDVESPHLHALNKTLRTLPYESDFPDYHPHLTVAYLKKGAGKQYDGAKTFDGKEITIPSLTFSDRTRTKTEIPLLGSASPSKAPSTPSKPAATPSDTKITPQQALDTARAIEKSRGTKIHYKTTGNESGVEFHEGEIRVEPKKFAKTMQAVGDEQKRLGIQSTPEEWAEKAIKEEIWHSGQRAIAKESGMSMEEFYNSRPESDFPSDMQEKGREARSDWDQLPPWKQRAEFARMVAQGEYDGTITEALYRLLADVVKYLKGVAKNGSEWLKAHVAEMDRRVNGMKPTGEVATPEPVAKPPAKQPDSKPSRGPPGKPPKKAPPAAPEPGFGDEDTPAEIASLERQERALMGKLAEPAKLTPAQQSIKDELGDLLDADAPTPKDDGFIYPPTDEELAWSKQFDEEDPKTWGDIATPEVKKLWSLYEETQGNPIAKGTEFFLWPESPELTTAEALTKFIDKASENPASAKAVADAERRIDEQREKLNARIALAESIVRPAQDRATERDNEIFEKQYDYEHTDDEGNWLSADAPARYDAPVPREKRENINRLAAKLIDEHGVDAPEKLAAELRGLGPKAMQYSQAVWYKMKSEGAQGPAEPEWAKIYGGEKAAEAVSEKPHEAIADWVAGKLKAAEQFSLQDLYNEADKAFGGRMSENAYAFKDATDAMELGVTKYLSETPSIAAALRSGGVDAATAVIKSLKASVLEKLPTQGRQRNEEMEQFQQFSTPPTLAFAANWVANIHPGETMMEPSAGLGSLAIFAKQAGAKVIVNELAPRRAEMLKSLGFNRVFTEDAEQLNNILPADVHPSVVVMNPPFSQTAGRMGDKRDLMTGARHIDQMLKRLPEGGRLVAIVGRGMTLDAPTFRDWWADKRANFTVRAVVGVSGKEYAKYGTHFDNLLLVIDKSGSTTAEPLTGNVDKVEDLIPLLKGVRDERAEPNREDSGKPGSEVEAGSTPDERPTLSGSDAMGAGGEQAGGQDGGSAGGGGLGDRVGKPAATGGEPNNRPVRKPKRASGVSNPGTSGSDVAGGDAIGGAVGESDAGSGVEAEVEKATKDRASGDAEAQVFDRYQPSIRVKGAQPNATPLAESSAMASVDSPTATYAPKIDPRIISQGVLSDAQLETLVLVGASHDKMLPSGVRQGFFNGDGTGVGKTRQIVGVFLDNWNRGRRKGVWLTENSGLLGGAKKGMEQLLWKPELLIPHGKTKVGDPITAKEGILFTTYTTLASEKGDQQTGIKKRIDQIVNWLGKDFDGVIAFDEAHKMGNVLPVKGARGMTKPAAAALAGVALQKELPQARVLYMSATGATDVRNLAYAERLGLWGAGTPFSDVGKFVSSIEAAGVAAMEMVARDMKAMGLYLSRNIAYNGVEYEKLIHSLSPEQTEVYDELAGAWQLVLSNMAEALGITGQGKNGMARSAANSKFWGAHQRFFNQVMTSMQLPSVIAKMEESLKAGRAIVIQLVNTNEAATKNVLADKAAEAEQTGEAIDYEAMDFTPRKALMDYVERGFPTQQYETYLDENGKEQSRPAVDSQGNPVQNADAVKMRDALMERLAKARVPDNPLDSIIDHFGVDNVAEVTGRSVRVIRKPNAEGVMERQRDSWSKVKGLADANAFQDDKKQILIFSAAGGTGMDYHADLSRKNQRPRDHIALQAGWRADAFAQGAGRTHRNNQKQPPKYYLASTNLKAQMRFISTIARRLDQMGALTKGQRDTGSQGMMSAADNLENEYATEALKSVYRDLLRTGEINGISRADFEEQTGQKLTDKDGNLAPEAINIKRFLNRMLNFKVESMNKVWDAFYDRFMHNIEGAQQRGELDTGMETIKADSAKVIREEQLNRDERSGATTDYKEVELTHPTKIVPFKELSDRAKLGFVQNRQSGMVWAYTATGNRTNSRTGAVVETAWLVNHKGRINDVPVATIEDTEKWNKLTADQARPLVESAISETPKTYTETAHMITGALLPIWNRLHGNNRVFRIILDNGERILGRRETDQSIADLLRDFQLAAANSSVTPTRVLSAINEGGRVRFADGTTLRKRVVYQDERIEITGPKSEIRLPGIFGERIGYEYRYFLQPAEATEAIRQIMLNNPPVEGVTGTALSANSPKPASGDNQPTDPNENRPTEGGPQKESTESDVGERAGGASDEGKGNEGATRGGGALQEGAATPISERPSLESLTAQVTARNAPTGRKWRASTASDGEGGSMWLSVPERELVYDFKQIAEYLEILGRDGAPWLKAALQEEELHYDDLLASAHAGGYGAIQSQAHQSAPNEVKAALAAVYEFRPNDGNVVKGAELIRMLGQRLAGEHITEWTWPWRRAQVDTLEAALSKWELPKFLETHLRRIQAISRGEALSADAPKPNQNETLGTDSTQKGGQAAGSKGFTRIASQTPDTGGSEGTRSGVPEGREAVSERAGSNALSAAAPIRAFVDEDMKPVLDEAKMSMKELAGIIPKIVNPLGVLAKHEPAAADAVMGYMGVQNKGAFIVDKTFQSAEKMFAKMQRADQVAFIDAFKTGQAQVSPTLTDVAGMMSKIDTDSWQAAHDAYVDLGYKEADVPLAWLDNHYRVLWKVIPGQGGENKNAGLHGRRPLQGSKGMLKHHTLEDMSEGLALGGVPYSFNPVTMFKRAQGDIWKLTAALRMFKWMKDHSFTVFVKGKFSRTPEGYEWVDDGLFRRYFPAQSGEGLVEPGRYAIESNMARVLKNWLSHDWIRESATGRGLMAIKNLTTAAELGLSPFHFVFETLETVGSSIGLGLMKIFNRGFLHGDTRALFDGLKDAITSPVSPISAWKTGKAAERMLTEEGFRNTPSGKAFLKQFPDADHLVHLAFMGGAKLDNPDWKINTLHTFTENLNQKNWIGATLRSVPAINEMIMKPLFEWYIPRLKLGMFMREMANALAENSAALSANKVSEETLARNVWGFVEARFGEMNFDNLFWNRTFKASAQLLLRSVTWKLGSVEALGGSATGQAREFMDAIRERRAPQLHRNMAWLLGLSVLTATLGAVMQKVLSGKNPESIKDFVYPRIDPHDDHARVGLPTYIKDVVHLQHSPAQFATSSLSGWIGRVTDLWRNQDFYGTKIRNEDDPLLRQAADAAKYGAQVFLPFTLRGYQNLQEQDVSQLRRLLALAGFNPAPKYIGQSKAEQQAQKYQMESMPIGGRTAEQAEKSRALSLATQQMRRGEPVTSKPGGHALTPQEMQTVQKRVALTPLQWRVKGLPIDQAERVYANAKPLEKVELGAIMATKRANSQKKAAGPMFAGFN